MPTTTWLLPTARTIDAGSGTWTNDVNIQADDGAEATFSLAVKNTTGRWLRGQTFNVDSAVPSGATIDAVSIRMEYRVNSTGGIANPELQAFVSGVAVGAVRAASPLEPTVLTLNDFDITADRSWTRADLLNGTFEIRARGRNGNSATDPSYRWDYVAVQVTYTEAVPAVTGTIAVTQADDTSAISGAMAILDQAGFLGRNDDGDLTAATPKAAENTGWTQAANEVFRVRFVLDETAGVAPSGQKFFQLQRNHSAGGGWVDVNATSAVVQTAGSAHVTNGTATARLLTSGTGTFNAAELDSNNGLATGNFIAAGGLTEPEYSVKLITADVANNDTIQLRVRHAFTDAENPNPLGAYSQVPTITVGAAGAVTGTIAVTQEDQTSAISGTVTAPPITGTIAVTQDDQTSTVTGVLGYIGTVAVTQDDQTSTISGTSTPPAVTGTIAVTQEDQTSAITGTAAGPGATTGTIAATQADQTSAISGTVVDVFTGTIAVTQADQTSAISGTSTPPPITGTITAVQDSQTGALAGWITITGTIAVTQADQTSAIVGTVTGLVPDIGWPVIVVEEPKAVVVSDPIQSVLVVDPDPNVLVTDPDQMVMVSDPTKTVLVDDPSQIVNVGGTMPPFEGLYGSSAYGGGDYGNVFGN